MASTRGSDRTLLYDVEPWNQLGFGVANFGDNVGTLSKPIHNLADEIGQSQLMIMTHIDAQRKQPPSINTVKRIGKLCNRVNSVLSGRLKQDADDRLEEGHATANLKPWTIHPVPFFGPLVRNHWLDEYNELTMIALTNMYQHSDNNLALTITEAFAKYVWQYFREIKIYLGTELLLLPAAEVKADTFIFTDVHFAAYKPSTVTLNYESLDTPGPIPSRLTEDDLRPLFEGIPANIIAPHLKQYLATDTTQAGAWQGAPLSEGQQAPGVNLEGSGGAAVQKAGGTIGQPTV